MKRVFLGLCLLVSLSLPVWAAGPHDMECMDCHNPHGAKAEWLLKIQPNMNPAMPEGLKMVLSPMDGVCLGCHNEKGSASAVSMKTSHPIGIKPVRAKVPENLLVHGMLGCGSCHNPHPSNTFYKYLQVDTKNGKSMGQFCAACHQAQADPSSVEAAKKLLAKAVVANPPLVKIEARRAAAVASSPVSAAPVRAAPSPARPSSAPSNP